MDFLGCRGDDDWLNDCPISANYSRQTHKGASPGEGRRVREANSLVGVGGVKPAA